MSKSITWDLVNKTALKALKCDKPKEVLKYFNIGEKPGGKKKKKTDEDSPYKCIHMCVKDKMVPLDIYNGKSPNKNTPDEEKFIITNGAKKLGTEVEVKGTKFFEKKCRPSFIIDTETHSLPQDVAEAVENLNKVMNIILPHLYPEAKKKQTNNRIVSKSDRDGEEIGWFSIVIINHFKNDEGYIEILDGSKTGITKEGKVKRVLAKHVIREGKPCKAHRDKKRPSKSCKRCKQELTEGYTKDNLHEAFSKGTQVWFAKGRFEITITESGDVPNPAFVINPDDMYTFPGTGSNVDEYKNEQLKAHLDNIITDTESEDESDSELSDISDNEVDTVESPPPKKVNKAKKVKAPIVDSDISDTESALTKPIKEKKKKSKPVESDEDESDSDEFPPPKTKLKLKKKAPKKEEPKSEEQDDSEDSEDDVPSKSSIKKKQPDSVVEAPADNQFQTDNESEDEAPPKKSKKEKKSKKKQPDSEDEAPPKKSKKVKKKPVTPPSSGEDSDEDSE